MNEKSVWRYAYAIICIFSALLTATSGYRTVIARLSDASLPELVVGALAGLFQLVWNDIAYLIAKPLKSTALYGVLPFLGAGLNILSALLLILRSRIGTQASIGNCIIGILAAAAAFVTVMRRERDDTWRIVSLTSCMAANIAWLAYFRASLRRVTRGERTNFL